MSHLDQMAMIGRVQKPTDGGGQGYGEFAPVAGLKVRPIGFFESL